ncbi:MAG: CBS domain-containing protein [Nitrospinaceae bacterium]
MQTAKDIMSTDILTVKKDTTIKDLSKLFMESKVNGVPVVDDAGKVIGVVTQTDLVEQNKNLHIPTVIALFDAVLFIESEKKFEEEAKKLTGTLVEDIYHPKAVTVSPDTDLNDIATIMSEKKVHTLPVVDGDNMVGVIGKLDVIRGMA